MPQEHATVAEEEYLQIMFWLEEAGLPITGANIARAMQLSAPTVHEMIGRLERDGYVERRETAAAREVVEAMRRRRSWMEYGGKWACGAVTPSWLPRARGPRWLFPYELSSVE
jgi:DtxR family Mn-dependent transcriptional regulator